MKGSSVWYDEGWIQKVWIQKVTGESKWIDPVGQAMGSKYAIRQYVEVHPL